jgi:selenide,water dikinase
MNIKLTEYSRGSGCGCKIAPDDLQQILKSNLPETVFPNLLVGNNTNDDAAVYDLGNGTSVISTVDFFMPVVNDAFDFGRIASCNAISDIYAMGGKPLMAVAVLGWPMGKIPTTKAQQMLEGARAICAEAGIPLAGGHSIDSSEPIFGLSVTGIANTINIKTNNNAQEGDLLFLTKPLGLGILSAALKRGIIENDHYEQLIRITTTLNKAGEALGAVKGVNAITDVTGFGLLGHLHEMCKGSGLGAEITLNEIPHIPGIVQYISQFCFPDITTKNFNAYAGFTSGMKDLDFITLCDPQTSGGLLISISPDAVNEYLDMIGPYNVFSIARNPIGKMVEGSQISFR